MDGMTPGLTVSRKCWSLMVINVTGTKGLLEGVFKMFLRCPSVMAASGEFTIQGYLRQAMPSTSFWRHTLPTMTSWPLCWWFLPDWGLQHWRHNYSRECWGWWGDSTDGSTQMLAEGYPWLRAMQQSGEYGGSIDDDLRALLQIPCRSWHLMWLYAPGEWTGELLSAQFHQWWCGEGGTLLGVPAGGGPESSSSWPQVQRVGQPLQSKKLGSAGLFWCGWQEQCHQWRGGHGTAA